jgi:hypothetical protein
MDVVFERTVFRVFLLENTLQVDLAFWPEADFGSTWRGCTRCTRGRASPAHATGKPNT